MRNAFPVFIGWDSREAVAFDVAQYSLLRHASIPLHVRALKLAGLRHACLYHRRHRMHGGQMIDIGDKRPFSTEFSFSRFLVPALCGYEGWALFCDCDFLFLADVAELMPLLDETKALLVCKQHFHPTETVKMDGQSQAPYLRKAWSSFMLLNCGRPEMRHLTVDAVNTRPGGAWLHRFAWLRPDEVGDLPHEWNWIEGVTKGEAKAVHFTTGGPWFAGYESVAYAREWMDEHMLTQTRALKAYA